jgi:hypothetical protein
MTRIVVSDTSPIRALAHLGQLPWLQQLFGTIYLPPAVAAELESPPHPLHAVVAANVSFFIVQPPADAARVAAYLQQLDQGEAEALALAEDLAADLVLVDEAQGRQIALQAGFGVLGTLGIVVEAKSRGWCHEVKPLLDQLETELRFFMSPALRRAVLIRAGELADS